MNTEPPNPCGDLEARLRFQTLIADLSSRFINLPVAQINAHINDAMGAVASFLGFNLAAISKFSGHGSQGLVSHIWTAPELPPVPAGFTDLDFPWKARLLSQGNDFRAPTLEVLPPEAAQDRATYERFGVRSIYEWCLRPGGPVIGCFSLISIGQAKAFPSPFEHGLQLFAQILANALARERADQALQESEARLRLAADSANAGLWILDVASGHYWITPKNRELFAFGAEEPITLERVLSQVHPEDQAKVRAVVEQVLRTRQDGNVEYRIIMPDGAIRWMASFGRPDHPPGGPQRLMGVTMDITQRKQGEEALRQSYAEIERLKNRLQAESDYLKSEIKLTQAQTRILGTTPVMRKVLRQIEQVAPTDSTVLVCGETGTGKELVAEAIHRLSPRKSQVLVKVNCAALPAALVESELFGREKGAFTGALTRQVGRFEVADGSSLFLDEVGELSLEVQAKLLRVLQEGQFERLGSPRTLKVNVRIIAATNRDLAAEVRAGRFREDLYYRLNVFPIRVPPLRERAEDIPSLVWSFLEEFSSRMGKKITQVSRQTMNVLQRHPWPGNVRELRNVIEHGAIITNGDTLRIPFLEEAASASPLPQTLADAEREHILRTLERTGWRIKGSQGAAATLGLNPSTLYSRMRKLGVPHRSQKDTPAGS